MVRWSTALGLGAHIYFFYKYNCEVARSTGPGHTRRLNTHLQENKRKHLVLVFYLVSSIIILKVMLTLALHPQLLNHSIRIKEMSVALSVRGQWLHCSD